MLAPRILNDVSYVTRINHEMHFAWQAQYLVKLECDFSWQAQHLVTFWEIAGARNVVFFNTKSCSKNNGLENSSEENRGVENSKEENRVVRCCTV